MFTFTKQLYTSLMESNEYKNIIEKIKHSSLTLGFQEVGFTTPDVSDHRENFVKFLRKKHHGSMEYLRKNIAKRLTPERLFPDVKTVICVRMDYLPEAIKNSFSVLNNPPKAYISRYALGKDYHRIMRKKMKKFAQEVGEILQTHRYRVFSDSAPVLEKALAQKAGLGWIGKHTNLISHRHGSYFFLGEIYTNLPLPSNPKLPINYCANCSECIKACPTKAIIAPYQLDARRCISYLTIEFKGSIPKDLRPMMGNRIYGCDDCQLVCPWNRFAVLSKNTKFYAQHGLDDASLIDLFNWNEDAFYKKMEGSPIRRIGYNQWIRNIAVALGNAPKKKDILECLKHKSNFKDPIANEHIQWAIKQQTA